MKEVSWHNTARGMPELCFNRIECHSETKDTHIITLTNVTESDEQIYYCSVVRTKHVIMKGFPGAKLDVTGKNFWMLNLPSLCLRYYSL